MSGMSKIELSVVLYLQTQEFVNNYTKKEFITLTDAYSFPKESYMNYYDYNNNPKELEGFDESSLLYYLQMKFKKTFPFSLSIFTGYKASLRKTILWWFEMFTEFDTKNIKLPSVNNLNSCQIKVVENLKNISKGKTLLQIVNAGPGTGKTESANTLAYELRNDGVLLISYTNESIKENYKRFSEYPQGKNTSGLKKYFNNEINLVTVDSLAAKIIGDSSDKNFDETIQLASYRIDPLKFVHPDRVRVYNHIIVDECQDIDDLRGNFLLTFCKIVGVKSLTLFGDPRQKIRENCGKWYSELWRKQFDFEKNNHNESDFYPVYRIGFEKSYRFKTNGMLALVNSISEKRPQLHVNLSSNNILEEQEHPIEIITLQQLSKVIDKVINPEESYCIMGPSIDADNKTTNTGRIIASIFRMKKIALTFRNEGAFHPKAIPFLTIHSSKGREFDNVFIFGMNNYPNTFSMIPLEEAMSLIFVSHSRAKKRIYYIDGNENKSFKVPLHVNPEYINIGSFKGNITENEQFFDKLNSQTMRNYTVTALIEEFSFNKFLEENRYYVELEEENYYFDDYEIFKSKKVLPSYLWGFITGFDIQCQLVGYDQMFSYYFKDILENNYKVLPKEKIIELTYEGKIIDNRMDGILVLQNTLNDEIIQMINIAKNKYSVPKIIWLYSVIYNNEDIDYQTLEENYPEDIHLIKSEKLLDVLSKNGTAEYTVIDKDHKVLHGKVDYVDSDMNVFEFKCCQKIEYKNILQAWLYHVLIEDPDSKVFIFDCNKGLLKEIKSTENIFRWRYIIREYFVLKHHIELVNARRNFMISKGEIKDIKYNENIYVCDTEFYGKDIFEIALVNINDPYKTICELMKPSSFEGMLFALSWLPETNIEMYKSTIQRLRMKFNKSVSKNNNDISIGYYVANTDVDWLTRKDISKIDLSRNAREVSEKNGIFSGGNQGPKLGELYTNLAPFPLEFQPHLRAHTALTDALMLYELISLELLKF